MRNIALIPAAGCGSRMGSKTKKQFLNLAGQPLLTRTVLFFDKNPLIDEIIIVVPKDDIVYCKKEIVKSIKPKKHIRIIPGGETRAQSVYKGLQEIEGQEMDIVLVHDGARPLLTDKLIINLIDYLRKNHGEAGVIPVIPVTDTIKILEGSLIKGTPDRSKLFAAQTPQCFYYKKLLDVFNKFKDNFSVFTDESSMLEHYGYRVQTIAGEENNIKITTPQDLAIAEFMIREGLICLK